MKIVGVPIPVFPAALRSSVNVAAAPHALAPIDIPVTGVGAKDLFDVLGLRSWIMKHTRRYNDRARASDAEARRIIRLQVWPCSGRARGSARLL